MSFCLCEFFFFVCLFVCFCFCFFSYWVTPCHPSIHLVSAHPGPGRRGSCLSRDTQTSLSPDASSSSSGRIPRHSQASQATQSLQRVLGLPRGFLPAGHARNTSRGRRPGGIRYRCPSNLSWLLSMWRSSSSTPISSWMTELLIL